MDIGKTSADKIAIGTGDLFFVERQIMSAALKLVESHSPQSRQQGDLIKKEMEKWAASIFNGLAENVTLKDGEKIDGRGVLYPYGPMDDRLKEKVKEKELELNTTIEETVKLRAKRPVELSQLSQDVCLSESQYAEQLQIHSSLKDMEEDSSMDIDGIQKEYKDAIHLLSRLTQNIPVELSRMQRIKDLKSINFE